MLLRDIKSNLVYKLLESILIALILLLTNSILAKHLSLDDYGLYSLGMLWSLILVILTFGFSLPSLLAREICQGQKQSVVVTNIFFLQLILGIAVLLLFALLYCTVPYFSALNNTGFILYIVASAVMAAPISMQGILSSQERMGAICFIKVGSYFLNLIALLLIAQHQLGLSWVFGSHLIMVFGFSAGFYFFSGAGKSLHYEQIDLRLIKYFFNQSAILVLIALAMQLYSRINLIMIDLMLGKNSVAIYSAAVRVTDYLLMLAVALNAAVFPNLMKLAGQPEMFRNLYNRFVRLLICGLLPLCLLTAFLSSEIIELLYGAEYLSASPLLKILVSSCFLALLNTTFYNIFFAYKKQTVYLLLCTGALLFNIIANYISIPILAEKGAAFSAVLTELVFFLCGMIAIKRIRNH